MPHMQRVQRLTVCGIYRYQLLSNIGEIAIIGCGGGAAGVLRE